jgi:outer membrane protein assembly factor BamB
MPMTLAVRSRRLYFQNPENVVCLDKKTGEMIWRSARPSEYFRPGWSSPTLVAFDDVVISADRQSGPGQRIGKDQYAAGGFSTGDLVVFSTKNGERLWSAPCAEGCRAPTDVFSLDNKLWFGKSLERRTHEYRQAHDLRTGRVLNESPLDERFPSWHHHRCYRDKATRNYILASRTGVEFIDLSTGEVTLHNWIRGNCKFGVLPCNGLLYLPPDQCGCYIESKLTGFHALAPKRPSELAKADFHSLEKGPAYGQIEEPQPKSLSSGDWPTFRCDNSRSGRADTNAPTELKQAWRVDLGGRLTQPVVADGRLFVASVDEHTLHVLDADTGKPLESFVADGRIDSPPTIARGLAVFGCRDGWVYALHYADGRLAWRYRAAPHDTKLVDNGRVESVWPVHGSVLIQDDAVYFAAGRSSYVDGGVRMAKLDLLTGRPLLNKTFYSRNPETGETVHLYEPFPAAGRLRSLEMPGLLPDVLSSDGKRIWMRAVTFDLELSIRQEFPAHLFSSVGLLDDSWWELSYWIYGQHMFSGRAGIARAIGLYPTARIMVGDKVRVYGYQEGYETIPEAAFVAASKNPAEKDIEGAGRYRHVPHDWSQHVPLHAFGLVLAGDILFMAGPSKVDTSKTREVLKSLTTDDYDLPPVLSDATDAFMGVKGGLLCALNKADGAKIMEMKLTSTPVFDGLIAADGRLYMSMKDGAVVCMK